ncbi:bile acid:sodium symporter family protein [Streptomyces hoynatensis]|uniref:Bile acid:sodium symporter n=1 Tax=Streptomyces hoynatensis TaxID=1141874 RepID=A0A3A9Z7P7_9ACTN|nr:bile acid:sodium symporter family protein [Streptomyces hoynatensis]RKN44069.1 bile acid:sodium symporter [Streptomyces hoynatensis]
MRRVDRYIAALLATVALAALLPADGTPAEVVGVGTKLAVGLLFFLYGARLSPHAAFAGLRNWRLHLPILLFTFAVFPLCGVALGALPSAVLSEDLARGVLFLCVLPSTVQSAVAFTSMARGNVAAAICSSSFSSLLGVFLTPLLAALLLRGPGDGGQVPISTGQLVSIVVQLLVPFALGQAARPWLGGWVARHRALTTVCDRGSILLVVYAAFSEGVNAGIWHRVSPGRLLALLALCGLLLALVLTLTARLARWLGFSPEDRVTAVFCASTKSLASGLPIATVLFAAEDVGLLVLPLMLYHTLQLMTCATLARRRPAPAPDGPRPEPDAAPGAAAAGAPA